MSEHNILQFRSAQGSVHKNTGLNFGGGNVGKKRARYIHNTGADVLEEDDEVGTLLRGGSVGVALEAAELGTRTAKIYSQGAVNIRGLNDAAVASGSAKAIPMPGFIRSAMVEAGQVAA